MTESIEENQTSCLEEFRRVGRALIICGLIFAALAGVAAVGLTFLMIDARLDTLEGFRAGIPATMLPADRPHFSEEPMVYKGQKMTARRYSSSASGTAANADYLVIINGEGIVEAAFSIDREEGREWYRRKLEP